MDDSLDQYSVLDLYCGLGGASDGYVQAGFRVTGVDWHPQVRYPYPFVLGEARSVLRSMMESGEIENYDLINASPPCQGYVDGYVRGWLYDHRYEPGGRYERQIPELRDLLNETGKDWVMENVDGAPMDSKRSVILCGTFFDELKVIRHRVFENNWGMEETGIFADCGTLLCLCDPTIRLIGEDGYVTIAGGAGGKIGDGTYGSSALVARSALGIPRGTYAELKQCVPPAYTRLIGKCWLGKSGS